MNSNIEDRFEDCDLIIHAKVNRSDIMMLAKLVEGLGHLGVVTTIDKALGRVIIQTTTDCWPDLYRVIKQMPIAIEFEELS